MVAISRRRFLQSASAASVVALATFPAAAHAQQPVTLRLSSSMPVNKNASLHVWYEQFAANLKARVGDNIQIAYFPNSQLGQERDVVQQVKIGSVDMMVSGSSIWATIFPEIGMLDLGFLFDSYAHAARTLDGPVGAKLTQLLQERSGCQILTWASQFGARNVFTRKPLQSLAEFKGTKLRVLPTPVFVDTFKAMGAVPTPIPFGELYMALQTGVVDGLEHDAPTVLSSKFNDVTHSCWQTRHVFSPLVVVMGKRTLDKIPLNLRPAFLQAVKETSIKQNTIALGKASEAEQALAQRGMAFFPMAQAERDAIRRQLQDNLYQTFAKQYPVTAPLLSSITAAKG
ncbi:TRAP transporter substrate-binding protein [Paraburkholderia sediminicola]|uniref:TRAP transporter substrate-binding protein n=1 Tax=Paraburkholderia sediminicola TaxID=458836 RepID=UPI0038BB05B2